MLFRQALPEEILSLFEEGYKEWSRNRTFEQYCIDNGKEDKYGTRYVIEVEGEIVSSLILLQLKDILGIKAYGIGSVLTPKRYGGKGYATELIKKCLNLFGGDRNFIFLYSDIQPSFYERFGFKVLPPKLQKSEKSPCMVRCGDELWNELIKGPVQQIPDYF